jgi:hypothetical protein
MKADQFKLPITLSRNINLLLAFSIVCSALDNNLVLTSEELPEPYYQTQTQSFAAIAEAPSILTTSSISSDIIRIIRRSEAQSTNLPEPSPDSTKTKNMIRKESVIKDDSKYIQTQTQTQSFTPTAISQAPSATSSISSDIMLVLLLVAVIVLICK